MADIKYVITVDSTGAQTSIQKFDDAVDKLGTTSNTSEKSGSNLFATIFKGVTVASLAEKAVSILVDQVKQATDAFLQAEVAQSKLNVILRRSGEDVNVVNERIDRFANKMMFLTGVDDDQIKSLEILARQYGIQKDKIDDAIRGAVGLTQIGGDLESNLKAVANAYNGNFTQLDRLIPEIRAANTDSEKMNILQRKMAEGFEMSTEAMKTNAGQIKEMQNSLGDMAKDAVGAFAKVFNFINDNSFYGKMKKEIRETVTEQEAFDTALKNFADRTAPKFKASLEQLGFIDLEADLEAGERQYKAWESTLGDVSKAIDKQNKLIAAADKIIDNANKAVKDMTKTLGKNEDAFQAENKLVSQTAILFRQGGSAADWFRQNLDRLGQTGVMSANKIKTSWTSALSSFMEKWGETLNTTKDTMSAIDAAINQSYQNKSIKMDNDYQKQLEYIKNSKMSEQEKNDAIVALDAEYGMKRRELAKKQAEQQKATAIVTAAINVAQAVTKALTGAIPPFNYILAAMTAAAGLVQIAAIRSAAIPLAKGAIFKQPTFLDSPRGNKYEVAEGGEAEIISNARQLREAILGKGGSTGNSQAIRNYLSIYLDGKLMREFILDTVANGSQTGRLSLASKSVN